jgi:class 3 adenylate cyclase
VERPDTRFARNGSFTLAYQVFGRGLSDLVYLPGWASNVEGQWDIPEIARFLNRLGSFARVIAMDRRNTGCSERLGPGEAPTLEEMVDDLGVVMRAAHSHRATVFAVQEAAFIGLMAAAAHPEQVERLILYGAAPSWVRSDELPWQWSEHEWEANFADYRGSSVLEMIEAYTRAAARSLLSDPAAIRRLATITALTQPPSAAEAEARRWAQVDLRPLLPLITVPTLVLHRTADPIESVESGRLLADRIPGAVLKELPGSDALPWFGEPDAILDEVERAVRDGADPAPIQRQRMLATVLFTDIVGSTERAGEMGDREWMAVLERHHRIVRSELVRHGGTEIDTAGDGFLATFDGPARAVECARGLTAAVRDVGLEIRAGVHTGEVERIDGKVGGLGVHIGARVAAEAGPSEVLVSQTVRDLVAGSGLQFEALGERTLKGVAEAWALYRVIDPR